MLNRADDCYISFLPLSIVSMLVYLVLQIAGLIVSAAYHYPFANVGNEILRCLQSVSFRVKDWNSSRACCKASA